nr:hypothetical protein [uncultured Fluviicola sp.]
MKQYLGILLSVVYAFIVRLLGGWNLMDLNSISYLVLSPMVIGFIPFFFSGKGYRRSWWKAVLFPLISILLFLSIAVATNLEDMVCLLVIGYPYILISILASIGFYFLTREKKDQTIKKQALPILLVPLVLGMAEKQLPKYTTEHAISNELIINQPDSVVWKHLFAVPDLRSVNAPGTLNAFGVPQPTHSTYNPKTNVRLGYFENGIVLHESVIESKTNRKLSFAIDVDKSSLSASPTVDHVLKNKSLEFKYIGYELKRLEDGRTSLKLTTSYLIHSNIPFYGQLWSTSIVNDFEQNLLQSLKKVLETSKQD